MQDLLNNVQFIEMAIPPFKKRSTFFNCLMASESQMFFTVEFENWAIWLFKSIIWNYLIKTINYYTTYCTMIMEIY